MRMHSNPQTGYTPVTQLLEILTGGMLQLCTGSGGVFTKTQNIPVIIVSRELPDDVKNSSTAFHPHVHRLMF